MIQILPINTHVDNRGSLIELFRKDLPQLQNMAIMGYYSITKPGISRGPHEHKHQTDYFCFINGTFHFQVWDKEGNTETYVVGENNKCLIIVPPGIIHGYINIGNTEAISLNFPDKLYAGKFKQEKIDEIRHEETGAYKFKSDDPVSVPSKLNPTKEKD